GADVLRPLTSMPAAYKMRMQKPSARLDADAAQRLRRSCRSALLDGDDIEGSLDDRCRTVRRLGCLVLRVRRAPGPGRAGSRSAALDHRRRFFGTPPRVGASGSDDRKARRSWPRTGRDASRWLDRGWPPGAVGDKPWSLEFVRNLDRARSLHVCP